MTYYLYRLWQKIGLTLGFLAMIGMSHQVFGASMYVDTGVDEYNTDGDCSFREALNTINTDTATDGCTVPDDDTIRFDISTSDPSYDSGSQTFDIDLTTSLSTISKAITIDGSDQSGAICSGGSPVVKIFLEASAATNGPQTDTGSMALSCVGLKKGKTHGDIIDPTVSNYAPADNATDVIIDANLVLTFSEKVTTQTGTNNNIIIYKASDDSIFETIDAKDAKVTGSGTTTITINPGSDFDNSTSYYINIGAEAFDDTAGRSYAGINNTTTWNFTTE